LVMMSVDKGDYVGLSEVGARIWELIDTPRELETLCSKLQEEFDVSNEICHADVEAFLKDLVHHGAIAVEPPPDCDARASRQPAARAFSRSCAWPAGSAIPIVLCLISTTGTALLHFGNANRPSVNKSR